MAERIRPSENEGSTNRAAPDSAVLRSVADAVGRLRFGVVQLTVHEGRVVQLDVTERQRFA